MPGQLPVDWRRIAAGAERFRRPVGLAIAVLILVGVYALVRATGGTPNPLVHLDYVAIIVAAIAAGSVGGVAAGLAAGLMLGPLMPDSTAASATLLAHLGWLIRLGVYVLAGALVAGVWQWASRVGRIEAARGEARRMLDAAWREPTSQAACDRLLAELARWRPSLLATLYGIDPPGRVEVIAAWAASSAVRAARELTPDQGSLVAAASGLPRRRPLDPARAAAYGAYGARSETIVPLGLDGRPVGTLRLVGTDEAQPLDEDELHGLLELASGGAALVERALHDEQAATRHAGDLVRGVLEHPETLAPVFQPILSLEGGAVAGYEALARFATEPAEPPDRWFARAADAGLSAALQALAITRARETATTARLPAGCFLSVNVSPTLLAHPLVASALMGPLDRVVIELTEEEAISDYAALRAAMARYRARGARFAVDDAGAGYASLRHVTELRPDFVKLDARLTAGLIDDEGRQALVRAMQTFAADIGAVVIAEGVETREELDLLAATGKPVLAQGYAIARPAPAWPAVAPCCAAWTQARRPPTVTRRRSGSAPAAHPTAS